MAVALVSILAQDRVGLVSGIADHLFEAGVNLGDTTFVLGTGAEFTSVCELPSGLTLEALEQELVQLPSLASAQVRVVPYMFDPRLDETGKVTHRITISGGDQLGLVARLSHVFAQHAANIVRLEARKLPEAEGALYVTRFAVSIPPDRASSCPATVANTAGALGLASHAEECAF